MKHRIVAKKICYLALLNYKDLTVFFNKQQGRAPLLLQIIFFIIPVKYVSKSLRVKD